MRGAPALVNDRLQLIVWLFRRPFSLVCTPFRRDEVLSLTAVVTLHAVLALSVALVIHSCIRAMEGVRPHFLVRYLGIPLHAVHLNFLTD